MGTGPKVRCKKCSDVIQSTYRHDFKRCKCGAIAIDGGSAYTKLVGDRTNMEDPNLIKQQLREESLIIGDEDGEKKT